MNGIFLIFPDAAQFADIARSLVSGLGYGGKIAFWGERTFEIVKDKVFPSPWVPPVMPISIAGAFKIFGVNDFAVIATSFFYFLLLLVFTFLLARKVFRSNLVGILSVLAVGFNQSLISYATNGASEMPLMFEIVSAAHFLYLKKKWATAIGFLMLILMYFTRPQAFIYILGLILFYLLSRYDIKRSILLFVGTLVVGLFVDRFLLSPLAGKYFLYPILGRGLSTVNQAVTGSSTSEFLRGASPVFSASQIFKKVLYDLYNFYKLLPEILSPYLFALFAVGLFLRDKEDKTKNALKISTIFMVVVTFFITAITIPLFRYLHPVIPLVYIFAVGTLVWMVRLIAKNKKLAVNTISVFLVIFFCVGQTLGLFFLDSRAIAKTVNKGQPPVYAALSKILKENTGPNDIVITNLNSWGSWYGERKTVWYPIKPDMIIPPSGDENHFNAIYLTSYLMDDENSYMGSEWRQIFNNPTKIQDSYIVTNYKLKGIYEIKADDTYEKQTARAVLLVKK